MAIDLEEIAELAETAGECMQDIQRSLRSRDDISEARVRFPRGYVRTTAAIYNDLPEIGDHTKRRNFAYQLMRADVVRWLLTRTDIYGQIQSVLVAEMICILAYGIEFFAKSMTYRIIGRKRPLERHLQNLVDRRIIEAGLKKDLVWMWDIRTHEHLDSTSDLRHCSHGRTDFNRAVGAWNDFIEALRAT